MSLARTSTYLGNAPPSLPPSIPATSPLISHLARSFQPLVAEELAREPDLSVFLRTLPESSWAVLVPLVSDNSLIGLLSVGSKLARDPFFAEDIEFLSTIAAQSATAVINARLYSQVLLVNEYLNNILRTIDSAVIAVSNSGHITLFNAAAERMTGIRKDHASGQCLDALPSPLRGALLRALDTGRSQLGFETSLPRAGHSDTPLLCSTSPLKDGRGSVLGAVLVSTDLTAIKCLEAQKQQAERLASVGALASGIAHEIKNPLVAIRTFAELLPERFCDPEFREDFSRVSVAEIQRIDALIARLRGLSSPSSSTITPLDLRRPLEETLSLVRARLEQQAITVSRDFHATHASVLGDIDQLKQLFLNLLLNAIHAMPTGGVLTITLTNKTAGASRRLLLDVSDTGDGIPPWLLPNIFDPFVTTTPTGSGLGLAISRHIADLHGAHLAIVSNPHGVGATATVDFPVVPEVDEAPRPSSAIPTRQ